MARAKKKSGSEVPGWIVTFADLMSILVCFFILLLSFSIMDIKRFTEVSGSMKDAFGVQTTKALQGIIEIDGMPTLENAQSFEEVPIPRITLPTDSREGASVGNEEGDAALEAGQPDAQKLTEENELVEEIAKEVAEQRQVAKEVIEALRSTLGPEINNGEVLIEAENAEIKITFPDRIAFGAGQVELSQQFRTILDHVTTALVGMSGEVVVAGHTDSSPMGPGPYRSNWDLSAVRAVSVVHYLTNEKGLSPDRLTAQGYGDTRPVDLNITPEGRANNRRVEIVLRNLVGDSPDANLLVRPSVLSPLPDRAQRERQSIVDEEGNVVRNNTVLGTEPLPPEEEAPPEEPQIDDGIEVDRWGVPVLGNQPDPDDPLSSIINQ